MNRSFQEQALTFDCAGELLLGILSTPPQGTAASGWAILIIVGGPQYRAGSHRQFTQFARTLATAGHTALRFDYRGMGDSSGALRNFEHIGEDIAAAIGVLHQQPTPPRHVVLFGLCDAASAALMYLHDKADPRVNALCLLNPWVRSETTLARTHLKHYYLKRLTDKAFWHRLYSGAIGLSQVKDLLRSFGQALRPSGEKSSANANSKPPFQSAMARGWKRFSGHTLLVVCGDDLTAQEFLGHIGSSAEWQGLLSRQRVRRLDMPQADHTLSTPHAQSEFEQAVLSWLTALPFAGSHP